MNESANQLLKHLTKEPLSQERDPLLRFCQRLCHGDEGALARAISLADSNLGLSSAIHRLIIDQTGSASVIGFTGPPGVGKSTLIDAFITQLRSMKKRVAVVAVDPSSPLSGGAVLGDRTRMGRHTDDPGVFIRSVSARGHLGGLSMNILRIMDLIDAAGWDVIVLETVGAGQSETEIAGVADISVLLNAPGSGDDVQAIKAGILEIADVLVVNKFDLPQAQATVRQLKAMLQLRRDEARDIPIICTVARDQQGIVDLQIAIDSQLATKAQHCIEERRRTRTRRLLAQQLSARVKEWLLYDESAETRELVEALSQGKVTSDEALAGLLRHIREANAA